jgi:multicomponent Na+:H+ antiporter subunit C
MTIYLLAIVLFLIGLFGLLTKRNIIKMIISLAIMENSVNLFFVLSGFNRNGAPDPIPESIVVGIVVIELALLMVMAALAVKIYRRYGTFDMTKINRLKG